MHRNKFLNATAALPGPKYSKNRSNLTFLSKGQLLTSRNKISFRLRFGIEVGDYQSTIDDSESLLATDDAIAVLRSATTPT